MFMNRLFIPGGEWLYFKLYTGYKSADLLLTEYLLPLCNDLKNNNLIDKYFFIRYGDPKNHIRLRLHVNNTLNYGVIFQTFHKYISPCINNNLIWNVQCDTYKREIERYGKDSISRIENIFHIDSETIMEILLHCKSSAFSEDDRWKISLLLVDDLLNIYKYDLEAKSRFMKILADSFKKEFGFTSSIYTKQLNDKYRLYRQEIYTTLKRNNISQYHIILEKRVEQIYHSIFNIQPELTLDENVIRSIIHMTMNRIFRSKNRLYEMVIYDFIYRYYDSETAKLKYNL